MYCTSSYITVKLKLPFNIAQIYYTTIGIYLL